jgi:26S proteasome regulatory subunit (ATPase 3-interacting protein)
MDQEIEVVREEVAAAKSTERLLKANLATLNTTLSTEDLRGSVVALELEKEQILARLVPLRSGSAKPVSSEEKREVDNAWRQWQRQWSVRKKIAMDVWAHATEVVPEGTTKAELWVSAVPHARIHGGLMQVQDGLGLELDP